jgi:hypothetical protein
MKIILLDVIGLSYLNHVIIISLRFIRLLLNFEKLLLKSVLAKAIPRPIYRLLASSMAMLSLGEMLHLMRH